MVSFTVQPSVVRPVSIYAVLAAGVATGLLMVVLVSPAAGAHDHDVHVRSRPVLRPHRRRAAVAALQERADGDRAQRRIRREAVT